MPSPTTLVWFRRDLRLADNPALRAALDRGGPLLCVFIWAPEEEQPWSPGAASRWWLHHSLQRLASDLGAMGQRLIVRRGPTLSTLRELVRASNVDAVFWNRLYEPALLGRDKAVKSALRSEDIKARSFNANLLHEPWTVLTQQGRPYQVFTPFCKACMTDGDPSSPHARPSTLPPPPATASLSIDDLELLPRVDWAGGLRAAWQPGEVGAQSLVAVFREHAAASYAGQRDFPGTAGTSRLSPHLHFGEIGPRQVWHAVRKAQPSSAEPYLRQLLWREFAHHLLFHFPHTSDAPLRPEFAQFPWRRDVASLKSWQRGRTGYPVVDAGMRELWATGWMHNRARMIAASFLVKDLLIPWQEGARWFWDTLVDADLANNTLGWQWTAGCGADAAPYFRIFNPSLQGAKFDPDGAYVRRWVEELADHTGDSVHKLGPLQATALRYPQPLVDHAEARERALAAYHALRA